MTLNTAYQFILLGTDREQRREIVNTFFERVADLGLPLAAIRIIESADFDTVYEKNSPTVAIYFGDSKGHFPDRDKLSYLIANAAYIIPLVDNLKDFPNEIPLEIQNINGIGLNISSISELVSVVLEGFGLLRMSRRLFISYKRSESTALAIQIYEELDSIGFDVFIDTHSVRKGIDFQEELWHRLSDSDVMILIDTPKFRESKWTREELGQASAMSVGIYQLVWPGHSISDDAAFCLSKYLIDDDFVQNGSPNTNSTLKNSVIEEIKWQVEVLRARNLSARQNLLIQNFINSAKSLGNKTALQPERYIIYEDRAGREHVIIPAVGVPDAYSFHYNDGLIRKIHQNRIHQVNILYDETNIKKAWQNHLYWLNEHLPVKSVHVSDIDNWFSKN